MAKRDYSNYQKKVIGNFYRNRDAIETQRLQEIVTEIYLATTPTKQTRLWERAAEILARTPDVEATAAARIVEARDIEALAAIAGTRFGSE
jgi:hypothetical protein